MSDDFVPPWVDKAMLARCICLSDTAIDAWVADGWLPPPRKRKGKLMWKWSEVDERLTVGKPAAQTDEERVRNASRRLEAEARARH